MLTVATYFTTFIKVKSTLLCSFYYVYKKKHLVVSNTITEAMKIMKVQTLGAIWLKCSNVWIENTFTCIKWAHWYKITGLYQTNFKGQEEGSSILLPAYFALIIESYYCCACT